VSDSAIGLDWRPGDDPGPLLAREWLLTNGLGGYASGSVHGANTRHYHGLLVSALAAPRGRHVMLSRIDATVSWAGGQALLGGACLADGPSGDAHRYLERFELDHRLPVWRYRFCETLLECAMVMQHGQNAVHIRYRIIAGEPLALRLRPFMAFRRHDALRSDGPPLRMAVAVEDGAVTLRDEHGPLSLLLHTDPRSAPFHISEHIDSAAIYPAEIARGYDARESSTSPGYFDFALVAGASVTLVATTDGPDALRYGEASAFDHERRRLGHLLARARLPVDDHFAARLVLAADQFLVSPAGRAADTLRGHAAGSEARTVIAGYHWFGDWGRDTMIALEGLTLCTGHKHEAAEVLRTFSRYIRRGLIPNLFPEGAHAGLYHTVDGTLWLFHALGRYHRASADDALLRELFPRLADVVGHHIRGTDFGIGVDPSDGLLRAGAAGYQLTWMDAKTGEHVVTPRRGKPVEIQALWYNALRLMAQWAEALGMDAQMYAQCAARARASFDARFWNAAAGCLFDVVDVSDDASGQAGAPDDARIRPNQLFSMSLDYPVLARERWPAVLACVERELLTPYGLRTLGPSDPGYRGQYAGDLATRDAAYHQGTVWPWLLGAYVDASLRVHADPQRARHCLLPFATHLLEAGVGSISEVFDGDAPFWPGGCIAQAWSVAEVLRAWMACDQAAHR
jgi:predicted glycogen debranching enzyme